MVGASTRIREVAVHNPARFIPCASVWIGVGSGTQCDTVLEFVASVGSILADHTKEVNDVRAAVDDGNVVIAIAPHRTASAAYNVRSKSVTTFESCTVANVSILTRFKCAQWAQVDVVARGRSRAAVGPTLQSVA